MNRIIEKGKTLLMDGPASVTVSTGRVEIFGFRPAAGHRIVIREGKRLPFNAEETTSLEISLGDNANVEEVQGNTIPDSWVSAFKELSGFETKPVTILVIGTIDSGKTSFCTYIVNKLLLEKKKIVVLDGDIGQSDIGPPCTVAYTFVSKPTTDLFSLRAQNGFFVGYTSPSKATAKLVGSLVRLKTEILSHNPDYVVVDSDGWVEGEEAIQYKRQLIEELKPDITFCIQEKDELALLLLALEKERKMIVDVPTVIGQRDREKRKNLRELGYIKYLRNARVQSFQLGWLKIEGDDFFGLSKMHPNAKTARKIYELLGMKPLNFVERNDRISIIIGRRRWIETANLKKVEEFTKKKAIVVRKGEEEGLLMALYNAKREFLGIGVLQEIDYLRKTIKLSTPVSEGAAIAAIGRVRLDRNMKEIPAFEEENQSELGSVSKLF